MVLSFSLIQFLDFVDTIFLTYFFASKRLLNFFIGFLASLLISVDPILSKTLLIS